MATPREEVFTEMLNSLIEHNHRHSTPFSSKKLQKSVSRVMEEEEKYAERNVNNVTADTLFQYPVTINSQNKNASVKNERQIASRILVEMIK